MLIPQFYVLRYFVNLWVKFGYANLGEDNFSQRIDKN